MRAIRMTALSCLAIVLALTASACTPKGPGSTGGAATPAVPSVFKSDATKAAKLTVAAAGGGVAVHSGESTVAVWVPTGAAAAGAVWSVTPLTEAPKGVKKPLCPGIYVDTAGKKPTQPCLIAFALPGKAPEGATIVKIAEDGASTQIVGTQRIERDGQTWLIADVDGFSPYTTSEEDKAAADQAFQDRAKARGKQVDWTIKVGGNETQTKEGWTFKYELDLFASGGGAGQGGVYKGHSSLSLDGSYKGPASIVKSFGKVSGIGRDQSLTFVMVDPALASLITGESDPTTGSGSMKLDGMGSFSATAIAPNVSGHVDKKNVKSSGGVPFTIVVKGEDVQVEVPNVGIFPGKILRTTK